MYFQVAHEFKNNNCVHTISTHWSLDEIKHVRCIQVCNSNELIEVVCEDDDDQDDDQHDVFEYKQELEPEHELWMCFEFYETSICTMHIFGSEALANEKFNMLVAQKHLCPVYDQVAVSENDCNGGRIYTLYCKDNGKYMLPDKAQRIVLTRVSFDETIVI